MSRRTPSFQLQVDRLVLRGFSHGDALRVRDGFAATLQQRFGRSAMDGTPLKTTRETRRTLPPLTANDPYSLGRSAAEALLESLHHE